MATNGNVDLGDLNPGQETPFLLDGSLEPALPLPYLALEASGTSGTALLGYGPGLVLPAFALPDGGFADGLRLPAFGLAGQLDAGTYISARLDLLAPRLSGSLEPALALPAPLLAASGHAGMLLTASLLSLPVPQVAASGGDSAGLNLPAPALDAAMLAGSVASATLALPSFVASSSGLEDTVADGELLLGLLQLAADGSATAVTHGDVTLDLVQLSADAATGQLGDAQLNVPLFSVAADGQMDAVGSASITLPVFHLGAVTMTLARPVTTALVLNTRLKGVVRYEGLAANSFASFAGMHLAATPDGIVALMGETDLGAPIDAAVTSGTSDLGIPQRKRIEAAYVGYRSMDEMEMTLITDEHHEYTYRLVPRQLGTALHSARVKFGRGVDGNHWQWKLANTNGGAFDIASLQLNVIALSRAV